ncbi:AarF/UbiB family protein, partial [Mycobacterium kansasii]
FASSPTVIISEWVTGRPLRDVIANGTQEERNDAALKLTEFEVSAPARTGLLHGDPHPGNFMIAPDGRLVALAGQREQRVRQVKLVGGGLAA